jgi:hypothetical protein
MSATFPSFFSMAWLVLSHVSANFVAGQFKTTLHKSVRLDGDVLEQTEEARRELNEHRRLAGNCDTFVKGGAFNMVNVASCNLISTTTIHGGETLRVRGRDDLDHPDLMRGGPNPNKASNGYVQNWPVHSYSRIHNHHFVMNGDSDLTLMNLKLSGAWSGYWGNYGYCCNQHCCQIVSPF